MEYKEFREAYLAKAGEIDEFLKYEQAVRLAAAFPDAVKFGCDFLFKGRSEVKKCMDAIYDVFGGDQFRVFDYMFDLGALHQRTEAVISLGKANGEKYTRLLEDLTGLINEAEGSGIPVEQEKSQTVRYVETYLSDTAIGAFLRQVLPQRGDDTKPTAH